MRYLQRLRDFHSHLEQLIERHRTFMQPLGQRLSTQVLHHQEISSILRTDVIEMTDVSMVQGGNGARFTLEVPFELGIVRKMSRQDLDRDGASLRSALQRMQRFWMVCRRLLPWDYFRVARYPSRNRRQVPNESFQLTHKRTSSLQTTHFHLMTVYRAESGPR